MPSSRNRRRLPHLLMLLVAVLLSPALVAARASATTGSVPTTTTVAFSPNPAAAGQTVRITVTVTPRSPGPAPTGVINFGSTAEGATTAVLNAQNPDVAIVDLPTDATGAPMSADISAYYPGDANYAPSVSIPKTLTIGPDPLTISPPALPDAAVGTAYTATLAARGGTAPFHWSVVDRALPPGLSLDTATGLISGTPTTPGTGGFTVEVRDSAGIPFRAVANLQIVVGGTTPGPVEITDAMLPGGIVGAPYDATVTASGGMIPYNWRIVSGSLPPGLSLDGNNGRITGTPSAPGTSNLTATVYDSTVPFETASRDLTLTVDPAPSPLVVTSYPTLPSATVGLPYQAVLSASGGAAPYRWSLGVGSVLPQGLNLQADGSITGIPTSAGQRSFSVRVSDADSPAQSATRAFTLTVGIAAHPDLAVAINHVGDFVHGRRGTFRLTVTNTGTAATSGVLTLTVKLPRGLTYASISGTGWSCHHNGGTVTCSRTHPLSVGTSSQLRLLVSIPAPAGSVRTATATIVPTDGTPADNAAATRVAVQGG